MLQWFAKCALLLTVALAWQRNPNALGFMSPAWRVATRFYEAQMSGNVPSWSRASIAQRGWRSRSHMLDGTGPDGIGKDLSGGWYDAGDHLKLHLPLGVSASLLAYGTLTWESAARAASNWDITVRNLDWVASYLVKCHYNASNNASANAFVAQIGDVDTDHSQWWGRPEQQPQGGARGSAGWRPVFTIKAGVPGADIVAEAAASLAGISVLLKRSGASYNPSRAQQLLIRARQLFAFARTVPGTWSPPVGLTNAYPSTSYNDDMAWAAAWLCRADVDAGIRVTVSTYCAAALSYWDAASASASLDLSWDNMAAAAALLLRDTGAGGKNYTDRYDAFLTRLLNKWMNAPDCSASSELPCYTPQGLAWYSEWGSNRYAANVAMVAMMASRFTGGSGLSLNPAGRRSRICWARDQIYYTLGLPPATSKQSFVVGYTPYPVGYKSPVRPHHRSSSCNRNYNTSCSWPELNTAAPNPNILYGALVGGPGRDDSYRDDRTDFKSNEVALDYNAGFVAALAGLAYYDQKILAQVAAKVNCNWALFCIARCDPFAPLPSRPPPASTPPPTSSPPPSASPSPQPPPSSSPSPASSPPPSSSSPPPRSSSPPPLLSSSAPPPSVPPCGVNDWECNQCNSDSRVTNKDACRACVFAVKGTSVDASSCRSCAAASQDATVQGICMTECVAKATTSNAAWACHAYCATPTYVNNEVPRVRECTSCLFNPNVTNNWDCSSCMDIGNKQADAADARAFCFKCISSAANIASGQRTWACGQCTQRFSNNNDREWCQATW